MPNPEGLEKFRRICVRGMRQEMRYGLCDSGSAYNGIVTRLAKEYGFGLKEAVKTAQSWEKEAGYNRCF